MNEVWVSIALALFGAALGSFAAAQVWRLRAGQLAADKQAKEPYDKKEYSKLKKLLGKRVVDDRSQCLSCGYTLRWFDLIPIVSWLSLGGKCRHCHRPIGFFEIGMELGLAAFFVISYLWWPGGVGSVLAAAHLATWLVAGVVLAMLFAYDAKWFLLPDRLTILLAVLGGVIVALTALQTGAIGGTILTALGSVAILSGIYAFIYVISRGQWVGFGDVKLGIGLGLILVDWQLAAVALFLANFIGCIIVIPLMAMKKLTRTSHVPFGPLLIAGTVLAWFVGWPLITTYLFSLGF